MKEEKDMAQSDSLKTSGGVLRSAGVENCDVPIYPSDEDINQIASMPLEQIKSELTQMGALDTPIPTRSALFKSLRASSKYEAETKQYKRAIWSLRRLKEMGLAWLGNKSSLTLRVGVSELALASLILIVSSGSALYLLRLEDNVSIPAPAMPDLLNMTVRIPKTSNDKSTHASHPERLGTEASLMKESSTSLQRRRGRKQRTDTHTRTITQLEANRREARESESRMQHQLTATSNLKRLVLEVTQKGKQEDVLVSNMEMSQPFDE